MNLGDVLLVGGVFGIGYWVGKKAIPQGQRIEETKSLLKLAQRCQELAPTTELKREATLVVFEIETYIKDGVEKKSDSEHKSVLSKIQSKIVSLVKGDSSQTEEPLEITLDADDPELHSDEDTEDRHNGRAKIRTPSSAKF